MRPFPGDSGTWQACGAQGLARPYPPAVVVCRPCSLALRHRSVCWRLGLLSVRGPPCVPLQRLRALGPSCLQSVALFAFCVVLVRQQAAGGAPAVSSPGRSGTSGLRFHSGLSPLTQLDPFEASDPFSSSVSSKGPGEPHCHRVPTGHLGHPAAPTLGYPSSPARAVPGSSVAPQCLLSLGRHASAGALVLSLPWGLTGAGEHGQLSHPCQPRGDR